MIKYQSFKLSDSDGINKLLSKNVIPNGQPVFSNNGEILIPYENGEPLNTEQKIVDHRENINKKLQELDIIIFVQNKFTMQIAKIDDQLEKLNEELEAITGTSKDDYDAKKVLNDKIANLENARKQKDTQMKVNEPEITDILDEIEVRKVMIAELKGENESVRQLGVPTFQAVSKDGKTAATGRSQEEAEAKLEAMEKTKNK
jgi:chromosome segregation ATPase